MMRVARPDDIDLMLDWAADEGWNPGLEDAAAFRAADPHGFFVTEAKGVPIAAISVVNHSASFAFLGLYLCKPEFRGLEIGYALWRHGLAHAGPRTVGLDGVAAQQGNYALSGFVRAGATHRLHGRIAAQRDPAIRAATAGDFSRLMELDRRATGVDRSRFLAVWFVQTATRRTLLLDTAYGPAGVVTIRQCRQGVKVGPLIARDAPAALRLLNAAAEIFDPDLIVDVPDSQSDLIAALEKSGFTCGFSTARMYRGTPPDVNGTLWGVATLELG
ncbi:hypothetical protein SAMN05421688_0627 [Poseidonocella pacifica]|uniref:N-acetyltransferase domain-containing protein n=1 Tax=Poseidonocella pacifica TaxID=871651 RepID=A0A1I0VH09_9RHOB|nr:GNAT family N-acetyltransferase [Poseidonocella pacifica]SFA75601.1 hypothetical protein SAMN05421688_0627 [Poseidonocella pacifica]